MEENSEQNKQELTLETLEAIIEFVEYAKTNPQILIDAGYTVEELMDIFSFTRKEMKQKP